VFSDVGREKEKKKMRVDAAIHSHKRAIQRASHHSHSGASLKGKKVEVRVVE
jgi:hypothetical protein